MHYTILLIIALVLVYVIYLQMRARRELSQTLNEYKDLMPQRAEYIRYEKALASLEERVSHQALIAQIRAYLEANRGVSPNFSVVKDIVERQSAMLDERLRTLMPMPLYYGLCGTIGGIILGLIPLAIETESNNTASAANSLIAGISPLLIGVALAMLGSLLGIILTAKGSHAYKVSVKEHEEGKNRFYHWFQINMLPHLGDGMAGPIAQLTHTLAEFNEEFKESAGTMLATSQAIEQTFAEQRELLELMRQLNSGGLAAKNAEMAQAMVGHIDVVRSFTNSIVGLDAYVAKLREITDRLQSSTEFIPAITSLTRVLSEGEQALGKAVSEQKDTVRRTINLQNEAAQKSLDLLKTQLDGLMKSFHSEQARQHAELVDYMQKHQTIPTALAEMSKMPEVLTALTASLESLSATQSEMIKLNKDLSKRIERLEQKVHKPTSREEIAPNPPVAEPNPATPEPEPTDIEDSTGRSWWEKLKFWRRA